jgi:hypothetical protein
MGWGLQAEVALKRLREFGNIGPPMVKQVMPFLEQLLPLYEDFVNGKDQFTPAPQETGRLVSIWTFMVFDDFLLCYVLPYQHKPVSS